MQSNECERLRAERDAASSPADLVKLANELDEDNQATAAKTVRAAAATMARMGAAWARLVKAERDVAMENAPCPSAATLAERDSARQALCDLGVDVDALLGDER